MGSETPTLRIPVVHLSEGNLKPGTRAWAVARAQIREALDFYGCFEAAYDGVAPELREATFGAAKQLFALPLEAKMRNVSSKVYHGYIGQNPALPYESLGIDEALDPAAVAQFTHLMWPQGNPTFCETASKFAAKAAEMERMVRRMVLESLGADKHVGSQVESTKYMLRFSEYAPPAGPDDEAAKLTLPPHVDANTCTLIYQNQVDGLEVQARSGDWVPFTPSSPDAVVFFLGDAFRAWSNGRLFSAPHRVRVRGGETRQSVMLFALPRDEVVIEAPGELVDEGRPPLFRPYRYLDYLEFLAACGDLSGGGGDATSILTTFCGTAEGGEQRAQA